MDEVARTLAAYEAAAEADVERYRSGSVAAEYGGRFLDALPGTRILDAGCGPGADLETFVRAGYDVVGLDISPAFVRAAAAHVPGAGVLRGDMRRLPLGADAVDGVWSAAALLHVPRPEVPATLEEFRRVLRADGVVYLSLKRGEDGGYDERGRYFEYYQPATLRALLAEAGLDPLVLEADADWVWTLAAPA